MPLAKSAEDRLSSRIDAIQPAPEVSQEQMRLISKVINLEADGRLILIVDPTQLLDKIEADVLAKFERSVRNSSAPAP